MYKFAIGLVCAAVAVQVAAADVVDLFGTAKWSFQSAGGSNGPNFATSGGSQTSSLIFNLNGIPAGTTIDGATLTILDVSTSWDFGGNAENAFGCAPSGTLPFFGEAIFCSAVYNAGYLDTVVVDGTVPGGIELWRFPPGFPEPVDPLAVTGNSFSIPIFAFASSSFAAFDDLRWSGTPPIPSFSISGSTDAELEINYSVGQDSVAPEPGSYSIVLAALLTPVGVLAFRQKRQSGSLNLR
ncbi:MAG: hypothetical protein ABJC09_11475 [Terriglobia bacterium]